MAKSVKGEGRVDERIGGVLPVLQIACCKGLSPQKIGRVSILEKRLFFARNDQNSNTKYYLNKKVNIFRASLTLPTN